MNVAIIPARGGSKGLPGKNILPLAGKPLIVWSIEQALSASSVHGVYVSTDDDQIAVVARSAGAEVIQRPAELATDQASSEVALEHAIRTLVAGRHPDLEHITFLQCTSPLRRAEDLDRAFRIYKDKGADSLLSVSPSHRFFWRLGLDGFAQPVNYDPHNRPRRQDMEPAYQENGSIYIFSRNCFESFRNRLGHQVALYEMSEAAGYEIDSATDFAVVETLMSMGDY